MKDSNPTLKVLLMMIRQRSQREKPSSELRVKVSPRRREEFSSLPLMSTRARKIRKETQSRNRSNANNTHKRNLRSKEGSKIRAKTSIMEMVMVNLSTEIRSLTKRGFEIHASK